LWAVGCVGVGVGVGRLGVRSMVMTLGKDKRWGGHLARFGDGRRAHLLPSPRPLWLVVVAGTV
jgi:hypothetical protein